MANFRTYALALAFYREAKSLKIADTIIRNQFERALLSVPLNIAENTGRITGKERKRFYSISMGSLREVQMLLKIMNQTILLQKSDHLAASLYKLIQNPGGSS